MEPINGWNEIDEAGSFESVELGGHICVIKGVRCEMSKGGNHMLVVAFDFAPEDKQAGYYINLLNLNKKKDPNAKFRGTYYQMYGTENSNPHFKAFINRIIESNNGFQWSWDEKSLINKKFCGVFGREEYTNSKGENKFTVKCMYIRNIDELETVEIPTDKLLSKAANTTSSSAITSYTQQQVSNMPFDISDDDLPF